MKNPRGGEIRERPWRLEDIHQLINLLVEKEISEFEMEKDGLKIRIKRGATSSGSSAPVQAVLPPIFPVIAPPGPGQASLAPGTAPSPGAGPTPAPPGAEAPSSESTGELHLVKSPIVGTFYTAPSPNAQPFVKPGDVVHVGQVLCIIEAMKLMNEIESDVAGEVVRTYVENGQPVEYGESLFAIKTSHRK